VLGNPALKTVSAVASLSGELWLKSEEITDLEKALWRLRKIFVDQWHLPCSFAIVEENSTEGVNGTRKRLADEVDRLKKGKDGEMAFPGLPWFAPCLIQPDRFANEWYPKRVDDEKDKRRALLCESSSRRFERGQSTLAEYFHLFKTNGYSEMPIELADFRYGEQNSFIAVIRLDADRSGKIFEEHAWSNWKELTICSEALEKRLKESLAEAANEILQISPSPQSNSSFPISPMIRAGEDYLIVVRRDLAVPLTLRLMEIYEDAIAKDEHLNLLCDRENKLTLSGSILFARLAYPFSVLDEIAMNLEHSAKEFRQGKREGCVDVYWLDSSAREAPLAQRRKHLLYWHGSIAHQLFSTPWTRTQLRAVWEAVEILRAAPRNARIPRSKWHDLLETLTLGKPLSEFAWKMWLSGLSDDQRNLLEEITSKLTKVSLWPSKQEGARQQPALWFEQDCGPDKPHPFVTVIRDLFRVLEMATVSGSEQPR
jgi:hypothetical protein